MVTIKAFAALCGCSTHTLRYYDRVGILKPMQVDQWSGYRYYESRQAIDYIKIKNLQAADFTIEEIRVLLPQPDDVICAAFDKQIAAQQARLERIKEIRQTYLREKSSMEQIIRGITHYLLGAYTQSDVWQEFGIPPEECGEIISAVEAWLVNLLGNHYESDADMQMSINGENMPDADEFTQRLCQLERENQRNSIRISCREDPDFDEVRGDVVLEKHGWAHVHDFLHQIPAPQKHQEQRYCFLLTNEALAHDRSFALFLFGWLLRRYGSDVQSMGCEVELSADGQNHFALRQRPLD